MSETTKEKPKRHTEVRAERSSGWDEACRRSGKSERPEVSPERAKACYAALLTVSTCTAIVYAVLNSLAVESRAVLKHGCAAQ